MTKGRPSVKQVLAKMIDEVASMHKEFGGLPSSLEANELWKDIWLEETHHSTALEGNTLTSKEVYNLVEQGMVAGHKEMRHHLEVQGYSKAARWVYEEGFDANKRKDFKISMQHISQIHKELMELVWNAYPPVTGDKPGLIRTGITPTIRGSNLKLPPSGDVKKLLDELIEKINKGPVVGKDYTVSWVARIHAEFEAIHPFRDGNGRTGRLLMNYILIAYGHPPAIILKSQRPKYIRALEKAQGKNPDYTMLVELVARSVRDNLNKLMLPQISKDINLVPLSALAEGTPYLPSYLRRLAQEGKLKAIKERSLWLSSRKWLQEYIDSRSSRGRR